ncbi:Pyridine nucleotide-disulphide oxidoreductase [Brevibacterium sp. Mu109]|uniref:NAD(P)-binding domain-containing protein n=1 Tax=Brevibacterium sp. Mu109 TaxID=1255669 RepID=UPI000C603BF2|nr:NAD(P)-binding domain-containing protein [Brevibacterium sp. Mu109]SMX75821.1 Pyridine nucleotide-disulphide oxidoreductase [Brevibacterium sp. Mu109]
MAKLDAGADVGVDVVVIGMGQAGLSAAYHLQRRGFELGERMLLLDANPGTGGAWQHRWPSLTLKTANRVNDLPGWGLEDAIEVDEEVPAAQTVPEYYRAYEERFGLQVIRPVTVDRVEQPGGVGSDFMVTVSGAGVGATARTIRARAIVNATGTWDRPRIPYYPGIGTFAGRQLHTRDYTRSEDFAGERVLVVGAGISAVQHLAELAPVAQTSWVTRTRPDIRNAEFTPEVGADVVARVDERVRQGLPPASVVSNTGLPITAVETGSLPQCHPMFDRLDEGGAVWDALSLRSWGSAPEGRRIDVDVILWATGFLHRLDHLAPLGLRTEGGGLLVDGRATTRAVRNHGVHLPGYGPSASTIGANRAGRWVARELEEYLDAQDR